MYKAMSFDLEGHHGDARVVPNAPTTDDTVIPSACKQRCIRTHKGEAQNFAL